MHESERTATTLLALLRDRVAKATGADRELDGLLLRLDTDLWQKARMRASMPSGAPPDVIDRDAPRYAPEYTASIDAAVALIERKLPGCSGDVDFGSEMYGARIFLLNGLGNHLGVGPTPPLALLLALLNALDARTTGADRG